MKIAFVIFLSAFSASAHHGHHHPGEKTLSHIEKLELAAPAEKSALIAINDNYAKNIKPLFVAKCIACHGTPDKMPWYAKMPGIRSMIEKDMKEAKTHIDMSADFPFGGHGNAQEDLDEIKRTTQENTMPPKKFIMMHPDSRLSEKDRTDIYSWVDESNKLFSAAQKADLKK